MSALRRARVKRQRNVLDRGPNAPHLWLPIDIQRFLIGLELVSLMSPGSRPSPIRDSNGHEIPAIRMTSSSGAAASLSISRL